MAILVTGTNINNTGVSSIVQEKPVPMPLSIQLAKDQDGTLVQGTSMLIDFDGITDLSNDILRNVYKNNKSILGKIVFKDLIKITGTNAFDSCFYGCTGITSIDLSNLTEVNNYSCQSMFYGCTGISGALDLHSLESIKTYGMQRCFYDCTGITSVDLSNLIRIYGYSCQSMFYNCTSLESIDLSNLTITGYDSYPLGSLCGNCTNLKYVNLGLELISSANGGHFSSAFSGCTSLESIDLSKFKVISEGYGHCQSMFQRCTNLTDINLGIYSICSYNNLRNYQHFQSTFSYCTSLRNIVFPNLFRIDCQGSQRMFDQTFYSCSSLESISFPSLLYLGGNYMNTIFDNMLSGCSNVTVHFPSNIESIIGSWTSVINGFGGTNTTVLFDLPATSKTILENFAKNIDSISYCNLPYYLFYKNTDVTDIDLSKIKTLKSKTKYFNPSISSFAYNCTNLMNVDLSGLEITNDSDGYNLNDYTPLSNIVYGCSNLQTFDLSSLTYGTISYLSSGIPFSTIRLDSFKKGTLFAAFSYSNLTDVYLPALEASFWLDPNNKNKMQGMFGSMTDCTLHIPSNVDISKMVEYPAFRGTRITILKDLPATNILSGTNTINYERNPKYDTQTALAWRKNQYDEDGLVIDWTPCYTSSLNDPQVGDTLYLDPECTQIITTIDSIS